MATKTREKQETGSLEAMKNRWSEAFRLYRQARAKFAEIDQIRETIKEIGSAMQTDAFIAKEDADSIPEMLRALTIRHPIASTGRRRVTSGTE